MHEHEVVPGAQTAVTVPDPSRARGGPTATRCFQGHLYAVSDSVEESPVPAVDQACYQQRCSDLRSANNRQSSRPSVTRNVKMRRGRVRVLALLLTVLAAVGCSDGGSEASPDDETTTTAAPATTQPPATDEASHEIVKDLVLEATGLADELFQDPELIDDPDDETLDRLREIYTPNSPAAAAIEDLLRRMVDDGQHQRPSETGMFREVTVYAFEATNAETLRFDTCNQIDKVTVNVAGDEVSTDAQMVFVGGEARRIDGVWRFVGLSNDTTRANPMTPGSSERGRCAQFTDGMESR